VLAAVLALVGVMLVAAGVGLIWPPAGVVVLGVEFVAGAYVAAYLQAAGRG
jgi:hypothetical protein